MSVVKGWCPGALRPMLSGDGYVVRLRPHGGRLTREQGLAIAHAARDHGNGVIELTSRANLQLRGISEESHPLMIRDLQPHGLIDADTETETRRNIIVTPFADQMAYDLAADLEIALAASTLPLPAKFGFAVDTGPQRVLSEAPADIRLERGTYGLILRAEGMTTGAPLKSASEAVALAKWFLDQGGAVENRGRMAGLIARGVVPVGASEIPVPAIDPHGPGIVSQGILVGFEFGGMEPEHLIKLSEIGALRLTPWRMVLIEGADKPPDIPGLIVTPDDPRLLLHTCAGAPRCPQAHTNTHALIRTLAPFLPAGQILHVSGCEKGCGWPHPADLTVTATPTGFDLIRNGRAFDIPEHTGLTAARLPEVF